MSLRLQLHFTPTVQILLIKSWPAILKFGAEDLFKELEGEESESLR